MATWGPTDIDVRVLTGVMRAWGTLPAGKIVALRSRGTGSFNSRTEHIAISYSPDAPADAPTRVVVKRNGPAAWSIEAGREEVRFYTATAALSDHPRILPECFGADYDEVSGESHVVLRDLSDTHAPPVTRDQQISIVDGLPTEAHIDAVVDTLAQLHAYWWSPGSSAPAAIAAQWTGDWGFEDYLQRRSASWHRVRAENADWLPSSVVAVYDGLLENLAAYWNRNLRDRLESGSDVTLIHGDAYFANFLCPDEPGTATYLIDWQSPSFDLAGIDLANLCATFWNREQRQDGGREDRVLRRYHDGLIAGGVHGYPLDKLLDDYRHGLIFWLLVPVQDAADGSRRDYWWPKMQCLLDAFLDHGCDAVLGMT